MSAFLPHQFENAPDFPTRYYHFEVPLGKVPLGEKAGRGVKGAEPPCEPSAGDKGCPQDRGSRGRSPLEGSKTTKMINKNFLLLR